MVSGNVIFRLYNEYGISIQGYQFDGDKEVSRCDMGHPPDGVKRKRMIELKTKDGEYCNGAKIYYGGAHDGIRGIEFVTNYCRVIKIGKQSHQGRKWKSTKLILPHLQYGMIGFQGRSGWLLDQISFIFAPQ